eukprot:4077070-Prymnesium_polylepis.2
MPPTKFYDELRTRSMNFGSQDWNNAQLNSSVDDFRRNLLALTDAEDEDRCCMSSLEPRRSLRVP